MSLVQVIIAAGLLSGLAAAGSHYFSSVSKSSRKLESSLDLSGIKVRIIDAVNCTKTLENSTNCTTRQTYVALKDDAERDVIGINGTVIGNYTVRARCNAGTTGGIEVRAARLTAAGRSNGSALTFEAENAAWFVVDEVNANLPYNWKHPKGRLFGAATTTSGDTRLCQEFFKGTTGAAEVRCTAPGTVMTGYNPLTQQPICSAVSPMVSTSGSCGPGTVMRGMVGGQPNCVNVSTMVSTTSSCPSGQYMAGMVNGVPQCRTDVVGTTTTITSSTSTSTSSTSSSSPLTFVATAQVCGDKSNDCKQCYDNGLKRCGAAVGDSCSPEGYRCFNLDGCRVFKCTY